MRRRTNSEVAGVARRAGTVLLGVALVMSTPNWGLAQLVTPSASAGGASDQDEAAVTTFLGLEVKVKRIVADPSVKGYRAIISLRNTEDATRLAALMAPAPTLVDDMGNLYQISALSGGIGVCKQFTETTPSTCRYNAGDSFTRLPSNVEVITTLIFAPVEGRVLEETLADATTGNLQARLAFVEDGARHTETQANDIIINNLELP
jgi:hypothetical protein